jgi:hypothetical protein
VVPELFACKDTLTFFIKVSRLEAHFSVRSLGEQASPRWQRANVYGYRSSHVLPPLPEVATEKKDMFDTYVDFFKLRSGDAEVALETIATQETLSSSIMDKKEMMAEMAQELDTIEEKLDSEESFVAYFLTKAKGTRSKWSDDKLDVSSSCISYESADLCSTGSKKRAVENGIIHLYFNGDIIAYRVDTLCGK